MVTLAPLALIEYQGSNIRVGETISEAGRRRRSTGIDPTLAREIGKTRDPCDTFLRLGPRVPFEGVPRVHDPELTIQNWASLTTDDAQPRSVSSTVPIRPRLWGSSSSLDGQRDCARAFRRVERQTISDGDDLY